ncbi:hypothetical protein ACMD2_20551 [Ananas comosus]|uniref:rRNA-processing protein FYV7 n=1 Tax=Ananas comosus TaxID=4615 RepID=A0A199W5R0_ANACO|nr:hypothetical protein ACMD2_20551 [Ananas comosus]
MKPRALEHQRGGDGGGGGERSEWKEKKKRRWRNEKRLGGKGGSLSLEAFANAKSNPSGYNPSIIKKQREFYRNAKFVKKYKKTLTQQGQPSDHKTIPDLEVPFSANSPEFVISSVVIEDGSSENVRKLSKKKKKQTLPSLEEEYKKKRAEQEKAKMEKELIIRAEEEARAKAESKRKDLRKKMFKKTRSGQPVMKYRIQHLLEGLVQKPNCNS